MTEYNAAAIRELIVKRYEGEAHMVLFEVPSATGFSADRHIDAAVFSLWPSKGLTRSAIEIKVSRSDFIRELQNPEKYKWCQECFHEFWFAGPKEVFQIDELPIGAGLMTPHGEKLAIKKHAVLNRDPKLDDKLLAGFMRAAGKEAAAVAKRGENEILERSPAYRRAKMYEDAVSKYCGSRSITLPYREEYGIDDIVASLERAASENPLIKERDQILQVTGKFQRDIASLFMLFAEIARRSILERDKLGHYVINAYGGVDEDSLDYLKKTLSNKKNMNYNGKYAAAVDLILSWAGENNDPES